VDQACVGLYETKEALCDVLSSEGKIGSHRRLRAFGSPQRVIRVAGRIALVALLALAVLFLGMWAASAWQAVEAPVRHAWLACVPQDMHDPEHIHAGSRLEKNTREMAETHGAWCTTQDTALSLPCLCCVRGGRCWSHAHIAKNDTSTMGDAYDRVDGVWLKRRLPSSMRVCYTMGHSRECVVEEGATVPRTLRAIERLNGWAPAGTEMVDYIAPGKGEL